MEQRHRDVLRRNLSVIVDDIHPLDLLTDLPILTASGKQEIEAQKFQYGDRRASTQLVDQIQRKGPHAFKGFLVALWKHKCTHVVDVLLDNLTVEEARRFRIELTDSYGPPEGFVPTRVLPPASMPVNSSSSFGAWNLSGSEAAKGQPMNNLSGQRTVLPVTEGMATGQSNDCLLDDLPYGFTKQLMKNMNNFTVTEVEQLKEMCQLTRKDLKQVKDGGSFFDVVADKGYTMGGLLSMLQRAGLENKAFGDLSSPSAGRQASQQSSRVTMPPNASSANDSFEDNSATCGTSANLNGEGNGSPKLRNVQSPAKNGVKEPTQNPGNQCHTSPSENAEISEKEKRSTQPSNSDEQNAVPNCEMEARNLNIKRQQIEDENQDVPPNLVETCVSGDFEKLKLDEMPTEDVNNCETRLGSREISLATGSPVDN